CMQALEFPPFSF
nr:immunoglobulin light chain junction region [Macaca mulatta]MOX84960.1 immunoglobulin light chain junction region [Macaca mulatta]MOX85870.1 immunoglobulin light chain junction region [Macaca mulatta]MOX86015.1 immunoglobulin light chain junction region [Macaca mulatta]MOX89141.1 immunoglobulin light chain junction region [Macaca mulatta]